MGGRSRPRHVSREGLAGQAVSSGNAALTAACSTGCLVKTIHFVFFYIS